MTIANDDHDRRQAKAPSSSPATTPEPPSRDNAPFVSTRPDTRSPILSQRSLSQLGFFAAGAGFLSLSVLITRRAILRKHLTAIPLFFEQSNKPASKLSGDGGLVAVEALGLATLNTMGFGIMATGGLSWAFDLSSVEELRAAARKQIVGEAGDIDEAAEREVAEYFSNLLSGGDNKEGKPSVTEAVGNLLRLKDQKGDQQPSTKPPTSKDS
ncbi:hypothetical protein PFICI_02294 [Pestalotiopsis fici W106-1]|uniref:Altered inheritance of mitochondria protein 11 n=1 Tax=Pestalotiopsis fici (strain W106-1 / CGMCC3.15140) TaxID=1229662 RepID=W3XE38_PESFW|nr:uncharacterized protein PFICI_02294 [Pestalotiopsis fici W106-1]ETS84269.1 hypothetical protein PFICI_02294 [Pestalotiopsis fici W106-1]